MTTGGSYLGKALEEANKVSSVDTLVAPGVVPMAKEGEEQKAKAETKDSGSVSWNTYRRYFSAVGSSWLLLVLAVAIVAPQAARVGVDLFLASWVNEAPADRTSRRNVAMYSGLAAALVVLAFTRTTLFMWTVVEAARNLHNRMYHAVTHTSMEFFHQNPIGRILVGAPCAHSRACMMACVPRTQRPRLTPSISIDLSTAVTEPLQ